MFTATYITESGALAHREFETMDAARQFLKELAKKSLPIKTYADMVPQKHKTRLEEVDKLLIDNYKQLELIYMIKSEPLLERLLNERISLEIEKHDLEVCHGRKKSRKSIAA